MPSTAAQALSDLGFPPAAASAPPSDRRFDDGAPYRIEIPSTEGPRALAAVLDAADALDVPIHRVSQGSGISLLRDAEIEEMLALARPRNVEVCLFHGPRAGWDIGAQARTAGGAVTAGALRGDEQLRFAVDDVLHACSLGVRSVLVSDLGLLRVLGALKRAGDLPADLVLKVSALLPVTNAAGAATLVDLGATSLNVGTDLPVADIASIRQVVDVPLDVYIEAPDDHGGCVRHHEVPELVRVAAPVYLKYGLRNAPNIYPAGAHLEATAIQLSRERVRRARLSLDLLGRATTATSRAAPQ